MNRPTLLATTAILLLSISPTTVSWTSAIIGTLCPTSCSCSMPMNQGIRPKVTVDCHGGTDVDDELLTKQLDSLLSSNLTYGQVTELSVIDSPLTHVPRAICRLTTLTRLHLDHNRLSRLPDNCFTNLTALVSFTASRNYITELQDGLFDGLHRLESLVLSFNHILSIGLGVFNGSAMLTSLRYVDLSYNRIQTLEPWIYYVGINGNRINKTPVNLAFNNISNFTNMMGWKGECGIKIMCVILTLSYNPIRHISDILRGWNISLLTMLCLIPQMNIASSSFHFQGVRLDCDCNDFSVLKLLLSSHSDMLTRVYCSTYDNFIHRNVATVPLDYFVCELTKHCPPGCRCVHRPANATLHVYCSNRSIAVLPSNLPELPKTYTKYKLDFSNNRLLRHLEHRDYFVNTSFLDVSNCNLASIDFEVWNDLANMTQVFLGGNQLQSLPSAVAAANPVNANFDLSRNPWKCACDASWMSNWLRAHRNSIINPDSVICSSPIRLEKRNIIGISKEEFCVDPTSKAVKRAIIISTLTVAVVVFIIVSFGIIVFHLRVKLYSRWKFHPFDRDECPGENMHYDLFLSCSSSDNLAHGNGIREQMERHGYRVCYPPRDFLAGGTIQDNIYNAVVCSKRVVCFLTPQFLQRFVFFLICLCLAAVNLSFHSSHCMCEPTATSWQLSWPESTISCCKTQLNSQNNWKWQISTYMAPNP